MWRVALLTFSRYFLLSSTTFIPHHSGKNSRPQNTINLCPLTLFFNIATHHTFTHYTIYLLGGIFFTRSCFTLMDCIVQVYDIAWFTQTIATSMFCGFHFLWKRLLLVNPTKTQMRTTSTFLLALPCWIQNKQKDLAGSFKSINKCTKTFCRIISFSSLGKFWISNRCNALPN